MAEKLDPETSDYIEKYRKYEADYVRRIMAKYFSKKTLNGGVVFEEETRVDNEIVKSSRYPPTISFTNPLHVNEDQTKPSLSTEEIPCQSTKQEISN